MIATIGTVAMNKFEHERDDSSLSNSKIVLASLKGNDAFQPVCAVGVGS
jgi:hypothetical protein